LVYRHADQCLPARLPSAYIYFFPRVNSNSAVRTLPCTFDIPPHTLILFTCSQSSPSFLVSSSCLLRFPLCFFSCSDSVFRSCCHVRAIDATPLLVSSSVLPCSSCSSVCLLLCPLFGGEVSPAFFLLLMIGKCLSFHLLGHSRRLVCDTSSFLPYQQLAILPPESSW
jgi:hypothetical protein